jgi:hypothetical protein
MYNLRYKYLSTQVFLKNSDKIAMNRLTYIIVLMCLASCSKPKSPPNVQLNPSTPSSTNLVSDCVTGKCPRVPLDITANQSGDEFKGMVGMSTTWTVSLSTSATAVRQVMMLIQNPPTGMTAQAGTVGALVTGVPQQASGGSMKVIARDVSFCLANYPGAKDQCSSMTYLPEIDVQKDVAYTITKNQNPNEPFPTSTPPGPSVMGQIFGWLIQGGLSNVTGGGTSNSGATP